MVNGRIFIYLCMLTTTKVEIPPLMSAFRITDDGNRRIIDDGNLRITDGS